MPSNIRNKSSNHSNSVRIIPLRNKSKVSNHVGSVVHWIRFYFVQRKDTLNLRVKIKLEKLLYGIWRRRIRNCYKKSVEIKTKEIQVERKKENPKIRIWLPIITSRICLRHSILYNWGRSSMTEKSKNSLVLTKSNQKKMWKTF